MLLDVNAVVYDGTDSYSSLNAGKYAIGSLMSAQMDLHGKQHLVQITKLAVEAHIQQIVGSGKMLRDISYVDLNRGFIELLEKATGLKLPINITPEYYGFYLDAPPDVLSKIYAFHGDAIHKAVWSNSKEELESLRTQTIQPRSCQAIFSARR